MSQPTILDLDAVIWLERWLVQYQGTLVLISHDRDFLDPIVTKNPSYRKSEAQRIHG